VAAADVRSGCLLDTATSLLTWAASRDPDCTAKTNIEHANDINQDEKIICIICVAMQEKMSYSSVS
jgi:hypothetical protein